MLKKTIIALIALGIAGAVTLTPSSPAEAFFVCANNSKNAQSDRCVKHAKRHAEREARWAEFWGSLHIKHGGKRG